MIHSEENLNHLWIELRAGASLNFFLCMLDRKSLAVHAVGNHGVQSVSDGENPRTQRNLFSAQTARVTGAVKEFMML